MAWEHARCRVLRMQFKVLVAKDRLSARLVHARFARARALTYLGFCGKSAMVNRLCVENFDMIVEFAMPVMFSFCYHKMCDLCALFVDLHLRRLHQDGLD